MSDIHSVAAVLLPHDFRHRTFESHVYSATFRMFRIFRVGVEGKEHGARDDESPRLG